MKTTSLWASVTLMATTASAASSCTASPIATLCDYKRPGWGFAVASDGAEFCWEYCNDHQPCNFVIFRLGDANLGVGTCWLYPDENYDASAGSSEGCSDPNLHVYDKPVCSTATATPTTTADGCAATASPSPIAELCNYPPPDEKCYSDCYASGGSSNCLSICANAESCSFAIFNPHNPTWSPDGPGTCWVYPNGTFDASKGTSCSNSFRQYVFNHPCPTPSAA